MPNTGLHAFSGNDPLTTLGIHFTPTGFSEFTGPHQGEHHQAQSDEAAALGQPLLLEPFDGLQQLGQLYPADAVVVGDAGGGDDLAGFDGGVVLPKFKIDGVLNHTTGDVIAAAGLFMGAPGEDGCK